MIDFHVLPWFLLSAFGAEMIGTMAGFGSATVLTPVASFFMDMRTAVALVAFFHMFGNASRVLLFRRKIHWPLFGLFGVSSILFTAGGALMAGQMSSPGVKILFGFFLIVFVAVSFVRRGVRLSARPRTAIAGGMTSGFVAGLIGTGGSIRAAFLTSFGLEKEVYIGTSAMIALVIDSTRIPLYIAQGFITRDAMLPLAFLLCIAYLGARVGKKIVSRIPQALFMRFVLVMLGAIGIKLLIDGLTGR